MLGCVVMLRFLNQGRFPGNQGRVEIAPATTPVPHLPSSGHSFRSCRSNQSLPDCLTTPVVIRSTPVLYCKLQTSWSDLAFLYPSALFPSSTLASIVTASLFHIPEFDKTYCVYGDTFWQLKLKVTSNRTQCKPNFFQDKIHLSERSYP